MTSHRLLPRVYTNESARTGASATRRRIVFVLALATVSVAGCGKSSDSEGKPSAATTGTADSSAAAPHEERVQLDSAAALIAGIRVENADSTLTNGLPLTGAITYDQNRVTHIGARTLGRVIALPADLGARVSRGQVLAELESPEVGQIRADEKQATALLRIARENYDREQRLATQGISSRKELLDAEAEVRRNEAALRSSEDRLAVLGAEHGTGGHFDVTAPFGGVVVARRASLGQTTTPNDSLFTIADLSRVWIELDVFERDLSRVRAGQRATVTVGTYPNRVFTGRVIYLADVVDPQRRTARARIELPNEDRALKPGMFASGTLQVGGNGTALAVVPQSAVQKLKEGTVVFVPGAKAGEFRAVRVDVGDTIDGGRVVILKGLAPGARVVTTGAFALRSELVKDEIGEEG